MAVKKVQTDSMILFFFIKKKQQKNSYFLLLTYIGHLKIKKCRNYNQ
jgi:hypothetical protein